MYIETSEVYLNKEDTVPVAVNFESAAKVQEFRYVESACTYAKGRALADAGYNVVEEGVADEDVGLNVCDAPMIVAGTATPLPPTQPVAPVEPEVAQNWEGFVDASTEPDCPFLEDNTELSKADALEMLIPFGAYQGKTLRFLYDLANKDEMLEWHINAAGDNPSFTEFVKACKTLLG